MQIGLLFFSFACGAVYNRRVQLQPTTHLPIPGFTHLPVPGRLLQGPHHLRRPPAAAAAGPSTSAAAMLAPAPAPRPPPPQLHRRPPRPRPALLLLVPTLAAVGPGGPFLRRRRRALPLREVHRQRRWRPHQPPPLPDRPGHGAAQALAAAAVAGDQAPTPPKRPAIVTPSSSCSPTSPSASPSSSEEGAREAGQLAGWAARADGREIERGIGAARSRDLKL